MKISSFLIVFNSLIFLCFRNNVVLSPFDNIAITLANKKDSIPEINLFDSSYSVKTRMRDAVLETMMTKVPTMDLGKLNKPFYKYMTGSFNGESAILNLNFAHLYKNGDWAFEGSIFVSTKQKAYQIWGEKVEDRNNICIYMSDKAQANFDNRFILFAHFDENNVFKGLIFDNKNLKQGFFEFKETNTEGVALFDLDECFVGKEFIDTKKLIKDERKYGIVYVESLPIPKATNKPDIFNFLKKGLKMDAKCSSYCDSFVIKGTKAIETALKDLGEDESLRNNEYSMTNINSIYWNNDDLVVIYQFSWANIELITYGGSDVHFETYDLKKKRKLTDRDVFKKGYNDQQFAKNVLNFFHFDATPNENGKIRLGLQMSNGFTSKGFYMVGKGNHGYYISPCFVPYQVVEPFLKDDFKNQYWKK